MSPRPQSATTTPLCPHRQHPPLRVTPLLCGVLLLHPLYKSCTASSAYLKSAQHSWCGPVTPSCLGGWGGEREDTSLQLCAIPQSSACGGHEDRGVPGARGHPLAGSPPVLHPRLGAAHGKLVPNVSVCHICNPKGRIHASPRGLCHPIVCDCGHSWPLAVCVPKQPQCLAACACV